MSTLAFQEPHRFSAGILALLVHGIFFSLLFFGFNWNVKSPPNMVVDMWSDLPDPVPEIAPEPLPLPPAPALPEIKPVVPPKVVAPIAPPKAEIEVKEKKKKADPEKKEKTLAKVPPQKIELSKLLEAEARKKQQELDARQALEAQLERDKQRAAEERTARENERIRELKAKMRAEMDAATQDEVARYKDMIQAKIRRNIVMPPEVSERAEAKFMVIVLPGGSVVDVKLLKSSGNTAYDNASERAIYKAQPLPMPQDAALARMFRELRLSVKP